MSAAPDLVRSVFHRSWRKTGIDIFQPVVSPRSSTTDAETHRKFTIPLTAEEAGKVLNNINEDQNPAESIEKVRICLDDNDIFSTHNT